MNKNEMIEMKDYMSINNTISEKDFKNYYFKKYPDNSEKNYRYYISDLYKNNIIYKYDNEVFKSCDNKKEFLFEDAIENSLKEELEKISPSIYISVWQLSDLSKYMSLQTFNNIIFIETYTYAKEIVLNKLLEYGKKAVLDEDYIAFAKYNNGEIYVVRSINEDSPIVKQRFLSKNEDISYVVQPKIEKIIVDIIIDDTFDVILSDETYNILLELLKDYKINMATIKRYANKKHRLKKVINTIESTGFNIENGEF